MDDLGKWLKKLGLWDYAGVFAEHAIDEEVLPDLTDSELKELGIPLGHRKKLLKAIAALGGDGADGPTSTASTPSLTSPPPAPGAEASLAAWKRAFRERGSKTFMARPVPDGRRSVPPVQIPPIPANETAWSL